MPDGKGGTKTIEGWLIQAACRTGCGPLLNDVHGGPASYALMDSDTNVFWQVLCLQGWSVLALNAVGSSSYGREFCERLAGHWGEYDLTQHLAAVASFRKESVCDRRVAVSGEILCGFLSAWAIGHTVEFGGAVVMAPVGNIETHYGTSDGGYYADPFYLGTAPRLDREKARALSPLQYVEQAKIPALFMQGKETSAAQMPVRRTVREDDAGWRHTDATRAVSPAKTKAWPGQAFMQGGRIAAHHRLDHPARLRHGHARPWCISDRSRVAGCRGCAR